MLVMQSPEFTNQVIIFYIVISSGVKTGSFNSSRPSIKTSRIGSRTVFTVFTHNLFSYLPMNIMQTPDLRK